MYERNSLSLPLPKKHFNTTTSVENRTFITTKEFLKKEDLDNGSKYRLC